MGNKFKGLIKDVLIFAIGNIGSKLILFFLVPFYTNYLSKSEYGPDLYHCSAGPSFRDNSYI